MLDFISDCGGFDGSEAAVSSEMVKAIRPLHSQTPGEPTFLEAVSALNKYNEIKKTFSPSDYSNLPGATCLPWVPPPAGQSPRIALLSITAGQENNQGAKIGMLDKEQYSKRHGYDFHKLADVPPGRHASWSKLPAAMSLFSQYDWLLVLDLDTIIMDHSIRVEEFLDPSADMIFAAEAGGPDSVKDLLNCGVFFARNSTWTRMFLAEAWTMTDLPESNAWWEQAGINNIIKNHYVVRNHVKVLPQALFNNFLPNRYKLNGAKPDIGSDTFIIHLTGPKDFNEKLDLLHHYYTLRQHVEVGGEGT